MRDTRLRENDLALVHRDARQAAHNAGRRDAMHCFVVGLLLNVADSSEKFYYGDCEPFPGVWSHGFDVQTEEILTEVFGFVDSEPFRLAA